MRGSVVKTPGDVRVDLAGVRPQGGRQRHRGGVRAAPAERRHLAVHGDALEPGDHRHPAGGQRRPQAVAPHLEDLGPGVGGVGDHAGLAAGVGHGVHAQVGQGHAQEGHGDALAGAQQHVDLAVGLDRAHVAGQPDQVVGGLAHGADHDHHAVPGAAGPGHVVGHGPDAVGVPDRRASELLDQERHGPTGYRRAAPGPGARAGPGRCGGRGPTGYPAHPWEPRSVNVRRPAARPGSRPNRRRPSAGAGIRRGVTIAIAVAVVVGISPPVHPTRWNHSTTSAATTSTTTSTTPASSARRRPTSAVQGGRLPVEPDRHAAQPAVLGDRP